MGNSCHCCAFRCWRRTQNQIAPAKCSSGVPEVRDHEFGLFSPCSNQRGKNRESNALIPAEKRKESSENIFDASEDDVKEANEMNQWVENIVENTRQPRPSDAGRFCSKRHSAMRSRFHGVLQRMTYSSTIVENAEDKESIDSASGQPSNDHPFGEGGLDLHNNLRAWQLPHLPHSRKQKVREQRAKPHNPRRKSRGPRYSRWMKLEKRSSAALEAQQTAQTSETNVEELSCGDKNSAKETSQRDNDLGKTARSKSPERPHIQSTTWFDEDFQEAILTYPVQGGMDQGAGAEEGLTKKRSGLLDGTMKGRSSGVDDGETAREDDGRENEDNSSDIVGLFMSTLQPSTSSHRATNHSSGGGFLSGMFRRRNTPCVVYNCDQDEES